MPDSKEKGRDLAKQSIRNDWSERCRKHLKGRKIVECRYLNKEEIEHIGWCTGTLVLILDDGNWVHASTDDEGNGPGALFTSYEELPTIPVA